MTECGGKNVKEREARPGRMTRKSVGNIEGRSEVYVRVIGILSATQRGDPLWHASGLRWLAK